LNALVFLFCRRHRLAVAKYGIWLKCRHGRQTTERQTTPDTRATVVLLYWSCDVSEVQDIASARYPVSAASVSWLRAVGTVQCRRSYQSQVVQASSVVQVVSVTRLTVQRNREIVQQSRENASWCIP
jgi:hypothetical protein